MTLIEKYGLHPGNCWDAGDDYYGNIHQSLVNGGIKVIDVFPSRWEAIATLEQWIKESIAARRNIAAAR